MAEEKKDVRALINDCDCGRPACASRSHTGYHRALTIYCEHCGVMVREVSDMMLTIKKWNKIQSAMAIVRRQK